MIMLVVDILVEKGGCGDTLIIWKLCRYVAHLIVANYFVRPILVLATKNMFTFDL